MDHHRTGDGSNLYLGTFAKRSYSHTSNPPTCHLEQALTRPQLQLFACLAQAKIMRDIERKVQRSLTTDRLIQPTCHGRTGNQ
jgi:hypothetical protein